MQFDLQVGVATLVVAKPLDAEAQSVYNMSIQVTDGTKSATAQVTHTFNLLCTGTAIHTLPDPHHIQLLLPLPCELFTPISPPPSLPLLSPLLGGNYLLLTMEKNTLPLTFPVLLLLLLPLGGIPGQPFKEYPSYHWINGIIPR